MADFIEKLSSFFQRKPSVEKIESKKKDNTQKMKKGDKTQEQNTNLMKTKTKTNDTTGELKNKGKLFVGGLSYQTTSAGLQTYFSQFGKVIDAVVMRYPESGKSRGFGFVMFAEMSDAESAVRSESHVLDGRSIDVKHFVPSKTAQKNKNKNEFKVFLGGLSEGMSPDTLKQFFGRYGEISRIVIPVDKKSKKPKGFGFLYFTKEDAFEKCLRDEFVHLGGRRIHIKRAEPQSSSHIREGEDPAAAAAAMENDLDQEEEEDMVWEASSWERKSNSPVADNETTSSTSCGERSEEDLTLEDFLESRILRKLLNFNATNEKEMETEEESRIYQKLLLEFLVNSAGNEGVTTSDENLIVFSDDEDEDDNDIHSESEANTLDELSEEFSDMLVRSSSGDREDEVRRSSVGDTEARALNNIDKDFLTRVPSANQASSTSPTLKFRDKKGSLFCSLCEWTPANNSSKSFLDHCRTTTHRLKLKERFPRHRSQASGEGKAGETDPKSLPQKIPAAVCRGKSKSQNENPPQEKKEKQRQQQKAVTAVKNVGAEGGQIKENVGAVSAQNQSKPVEKIDKKVEVKSLKNLKMMALAKGMSCILPMSGEKLMCTMCSKIIPQAEDFSVVMKNVSAHLQSKRHLQKLLETECSLKESLGKNEEVNPNPPCQKQQDKTAPQNQVAPNQKSQGKVSAAQEQRAPNQKTQGKVSATQAQKAPNQKTQGKVSATQKQKISSQQNVGQDNGKKIPDKNSKSLFLCIPCNYFNKNVELFKGHLKSEAHLDCFISRGVKTDLSLDNLTKCQNCNLFLYGSMYYINKHYTKCLEKKTEV